MDHILEAVQPYGMLTAGALFGAGWWCWCDVIVRASLVDQHTVGFVYYIPGIIATLAVILMSLIRRDDADYVGYGDEGDQCRAKCGLFLAYCCAFGSIAGAVVVLLLLKQQGADLAIGVGSVCQTAILCLSGLITWLCKASEASDYSLLGW